MANANEHLLPLRSFFVILVSIPYRYVSNPLRLSAERICDNTLNTS